MVAPADPKWDVAAAAATIAHLASGKVPFESVPAAMIAVHHTDGKAMNHMYLDLVPEGIRCSYAWH